MIEFTPGPESLDDGNGHYGKGDEELKSVATEEGMELNEVSGAQWDEAFQMVREELNKLMEKEPKWRKMEEIGKEMMRDASDY